MQQKWTFCRKDDRWQQGYQPGKRLGVSTPGEQLRDKAPAALNSKVGHVKHVMSGTDEGNNRLLHRPTIAVTAAKEIVGRIDVASVPS